MKKWRRMVSSLLAAALLLTAVPTVWAAEEDTGFSDVAADAWYAGAVEYVRDNGLMSGTGSATFSPNAATSRAMLATVLYRAAGSPAAEGTAAFSDVAADAWYADAVAWASENGIVSGYGNGLFGTNDPVSREQIATILWRYEGSPSAESGQDFADESAISGYASTAVDWARANGIISGREGNVFDPKGNATRAEVAAMLQNDLTRQPDGEIQPDGDAGDVLVVYFSMPETDDPQQMTTEEANSTVVIDGQVLGNTQYMAQVIQQATGADLFRIEPAEPYPTDHETLVALAADEQEQNARPAIQGQVEDLEAYDRIYIGYPIWWGDMPMILYTFFDQYDLSGKTIVPFGTHGGSGFAGTPDTIEQLEPQATVLEGLTISRDQIQDAEQQIVDWVNGLPQDLEEEMDESTAGQWEPPQRGLHQRRFDRSGGCPEPGRH